jgi:hypothetical protein
LAFGLYLLSTLTQYIFFANYYLGDHSDESGGEYTLFLAIAASNVFSFLEQLCLCNIFWQLSGRKPDEEKTPVQSRTGSSLSSPVVVVELDEDGEVQAAVWSQFVRKSLMNGITSSTSSDVVHIPQFTDSTRTEKTTPLMSTNSLKEVAL